MKRLSENTVSLIRHVIANLQKEIDENGDYKRFKDALWESDTIITFNWDTMLDDILGRKEILNDRKRWTEHNQYANFIMNLSGWKETTYKHMTVEPPEKEFDFTNGYLLKLHGSVDWFQCKNTECRAYNKAFPILDFESIYYCSECRSRLIPIIIPPVLYKKYNEYLIIQTLWNMANDEVSNADEIIIWGYSLPPTDFHANWLLRQVDYTVKALTIINPSTIRQSDTPTYNYTYLKHILSPIEHKLDESEIFIYENIDDYFNRITVDMKYSLKKYK